MKNRKDFTELDFIMYLNAETIAFYTYDYLIRKQLKNEYVDLIAYSYCEEFDLKGYEPSTLYLAKEILEKDYQTDMYTLPFKEDSLKLATREIELHDKIGNYLNEKNIQYEKETMITICRTLIANGDKVLNKMVSEYDDVCIKLDKKGYIKKIDI